MVKKVFLSSVVALSLATGSVYAENGGVFLGLQLGTGAGAAFGPSAKAGIVGTVGLKAGYETELGDISAVRAYISGLTAYQFAGDVAGGSIAAFSMYILGDFDVDYIANFVNDGDFKFGMYVGIFTGGLVSTVISPARVSGTTTGSAGNTLAGLAAGLNLGFRTVVNESNQFEFGVKLAGAFYSQPSSVTASAFLFIGAGYNYKF